MIAMIHTIASGIPIRVASFRGSSAASGSGAAACFSRASAINASRPVFGRAAGLSLLALDGSLATLGFAAAAAGLSAAARPFGLSEFFGLSAELFFGLSLVFKATASYHASGRKTRI
jgi:hypothetical protein